MKESGNESILIKEASALWKHIAAVDHHANICPLGDLKHLIVFVNIAVQIGNIKNLHSGNVTKGNGECQPID